LRISSALAVLATPSVSYSDSAIDGVYSTPS
jgi:hypothetical protein